MIYSDREQDCLNPTPSYKDPLSGPLSSRSVTPCFTHTSPEPFTLTHSVIHTAPSRSQTQDSILLRFSARSPTAALVVLSSSPSTRAREQALVCGDDILFLERSTPACARESGSVGVTGAHNRPPTSGSAARPNPRVPRRRSYVIWDKRNEEDLKLIAPLLIFPPKTSLRCKMYVHPPRGSRSY